MFVSISLTTYNRKKFSKFCIDSVHEGAPRGEHEFIVVDNGSTDGTVEMLKEYRAANVVDHLVLDHYNNLGLAINDAWKLANPKANWLLVLSNDHFCMEGWFDNFKLVVSSEVCPDYIFCVLRMPGFVKENSLETERGGCVLVEKKWRKNIPFGGGLAIKKELVDEYNIQFLTGHRSPWSIGTGKKVGSIYSYLCIRLRKLGLKYVELGKPCILEQDAEFANPEYEEYYKQVLSGRGRRGRNDGAYAKISKFESLRMRGGYTRHPDEYYHGSGYEIKEHYKNALASEEGQVEWNRMEKIGPEGQKKKGGRK